LNTNDTPPATASQHPRTNEGACESLNAAISEKALEREGWELVDVDKTTRQLVLSRDLEWRSLTWFNDGSITVEHDGAVILVPNCHTMRDLNTLVRLFTAPDAARARDEG
jgi:hypothetical protein